MESRHTGQIWTAEAPLESLKTHILLHGVCLQDTSTWSTAAGYLDSKLDCQTARDQNSHKHVALRGIAGFILPPGGHSEDLQVRTGSKVLQYGGETDRCGWQLLIASLHRCSP